MDGSYITVGCRQLFKGVNASRGAKRVVGGSKKKIKKQKKHSEVLTLSHGEPPPCVRANRS